MMASVVGRRTHMTEPRKRTCWVVTDGRRGIENQALGLAEAVARAVPLTIERRLAPRREGWRAEIAGRFRPVKLEELVPPDGAPPLSNAAPDLWIGCGRASLPYSERARDWFAGRTMVVQVQDPRRPLWPYDLVIPPEHDGLSGDNVFSILGSPNRVSHAWLARGRARFADALNPPPAPRAAVLIGGDSKRHTLSPRTMKTLIAKLEDVLAQSLSLLITTSRRTPPAAVAALNARFRGNPAVWLWTSDADGANPYDAFLAAADVVIATTDSTNMLTEAAAAGKPVLMFSLEGEDGKFAALYEALAARGLARPFEGPVTPWPVEPLRETDRAAAEIVKRLHARDAHMAAPPQPARPEPPTEPSAATTNGAAEAADEKTDGGD